MIEIIERYICSRHNILPEKLHERYSNGKLKKYGIYVTVRQLVVYYAIQNGYTEREAGAYYWQDHSTVHHAKMKINSQRNIYRQLHEEMNDYDEKLIGLNKLNYKEMVDKLIYNNQEKTELIKKILPELESESLSIENKLNSIKEIINDIKVEYQQ